MSKPTKDDANLMIQLMRWGAAENLQDARNWIWSDEFISDYDEFIAKYPVGSKEMDMRAKYVVGLSRLERFINKIS